MRKVLRVINGVETLITLCDPAPEATHFQEHQFERGTELGEPPYVTKTTQSKAARNYEIGDIRYIVAEDIRIKCKQILPVDPAV